jgi:ubiquinone/menaquinone biosynthesis C-methylase UbiE
LNNPAVFEFACAICKSRLDPISPNEFHCAVDGNTFIRIDGIWRMMRPGRSAHYDRFVKEYETVRQAEGRGSDDPAYYRALPFADLTGRMTADWQIRAASFRALIETLIAPIEAHDAAPLKILDLGAGNGWLSYQLAKRGHAVGAVDLLTNKRDGLGAYVHYDAAFTPIQAEFDHLPLTDNEIDLVIFNSSLHYSVNYETTLCEAWRVIKANGRVVILDSPVYSDAESGKQMVRERQEKFLHTYGFPSNSIASENFLTLKRLRALATSTKTEWRFVKPSYGWRRAIRPWIARVRGRREPARFMLIVGTRIAEKPI